MNKKLFVIPFIVAAVIGIVLVGCYLEFDPDDISVAGAWGTASGTTQGSDPGGYMGPVTVTLTFTEGIITNAVVTHTEDGGGVNAAMDGFAALIVPTNGDFDTIDAMSGGSWGGRAALVAAGREAIQNYQSGIFITP